MPKFIINGNIFKLQEYDYIYEIEANSPEDAAEQFQSIISSSQFPLDLEFNEVDASQNKGGVFHVFGDDADDDDLFDPDEKALIPHEIFDGEE